MKDNSAFTSTAEVRIPGLLKPSIFAPKPMLTHIPLANPGAYYRSKIFAAMAGINPLTAASSTLLVLVTTLRATPSQLDDRELYLHLIHEVKAFETQAQTLGYRAETILLARYILCATLDETLLNSHPQNEWHKYRLLATFHGEEWGGERFFLILDRLCADPSLHIDLLELLYLCLSLGFMGEYQTLENGKLELDDVIEKLYQCIRWQRGDIKKVLALCEPETKTTTQTATITTTTQPLPLWLLGLLTVLLMLSVYTGFNFTLSSSITPIYQQLNRILQTHAES